MGSFSEHGNNGTPYTVGTWQDDILGSDYHSLTVALGPDPDRETDVVATVVRYLPAGTDIEQFHQRPALLLVHGMTDYFFHTEVAEFFHAHGYAVYAIDLRKCGRSYRPGQSWHYISDLSYYFPDLNAASDIITAQHPRLIPVAHSTGGLIVPHWLNELRATAPENHARVDALVLNSPWLDMMYPRVLIRIAAPLIFWLGKRFPRATLPGDGLGMYGRSIHKDHDGEWDFDTSMKPVEGHKKQFGWLRAIMLGHRAVHRDALNVGVDVLTLCSERSWRKRIASREVNSSDAVLDVKHIKKWAPHLSAPSARVTVQPVEGAMHDVFLSAKPVRQQAMITMLDWLEAR